MNENEKVISILQQHVEQAVALINGLKQKVSQLEAQNKQLETQNRQLVSEHKKHKTEIEQYATKLTTYEENLKTFEQLLDEAQNEQNRLEQSILDAISGLGNVDESVKETTSTSQIMQTNTTPYSYESISDDEGSFETDDSTEYQGEIF